MMSTIGLEVYLYHFPAQHSEPVSASQQIPSILFLFVPRKVTVHAVYAAVSKQVTCGSGQNVSL